MTATRAAVLGRPIAHSLSPVLHRAAYATLGLDWNYDAIDCGVDELRAVIDARPDWAGFSCTMPLKHAVLDVADEVSDTATQVGAGNTLVPRGGGGWRAENTDVHGLAAALEGHAFAQCTVLGAGGTAQAAVVALARLGITALTVRVRDTGRAAAVLATAERCGSQITVTGLDGPVPVGLLLSTLPARAADPLADLPWTPQHVVLDVAYDPWPSALARAAADAGATVVSGAVMLLHQAAAQVELMTGQLAPVEAMREALSEQVPDG